VKKGDNDPEDQAMTLKTARQAIERQENAALEGLKSKVESALQANPRLAAYRKQIRLDITSEGLRIQIVDEQNRPMFDLGSARLKEYTREILAEIAKVLNGVENRVSLSGHTDASPYAGAAHGIGNWELSTERSNASRRELVAAGLAEEKIVRVVGLASSVPFNADVPLDPANRRISIVVMNRRASEALRRDGHTLEVTDSEAVSNKLSLQQAVSVETTKPAAMPSRVAGSRQ
jgi:chemotaxis protein MotB